MSDKVAILIPCYNEEKTVEKVIKDFKKELPEAQIYVYNNNSSDKTYEIASSIDGVIVRNEYNQGKGNVVRRMFREVDADIYVMVDGDDTYPAEYVHKLIEPIKEKRADMTVGDRLSNGTYKNENKRKRARRRVRKKDKYSNNTKRCIKNKTIHSKFCIRLHGVWKNRRQHDSAEKTEKDLSWW